MFFSFICSRSQFVSLPFPFHLIDTNYDIHVRKASVIFLSSCSSNLEINHSISTRACTPQASQHEQAWSTIRNNTYIFFIHTKTNKNWVSESCMGIEFFVRLSSTNAAMHLNFKQTQHNHMLLVIISIGTSSKMLVSTFFSCNLLCLPIPIFITPHMFTGPLAHGCGYRHG